MRLSILLILFIALPFSVLATDYQGRCVIAFQGSSTLHDFEGKGVCQPFTVDENNGIMSIPEIQVAVSGMDTDNSTRDKKMLEMFDEKNYPLITGLIGPVNLADILNTLKENRDRVVEVVFDLKIRNTVKSVTAKFINVVETDSNITADLTFAVSLDDYQLKPPSVLGFIRVNDQVNVTATFSLQTY